MCAVVFSGLMIDDKRVTLSVGQELRVSRPVGPEPINILLLSERSSVHWNSFQDRKTVTLF